MPINELIAQQKMGRKLGELRFGTTGTAKNGKTMPVKLEYWRLTSRSEKTAQSAAEYFGVDYRLVTLENKLETFEVMSKVNRLDVIIPPGEAAISQWMEMYSGGGCQRRCDGELEQKSNGPCKCPADIAQRVELAKDGRACKPTTRANVMLPYIDGIGTWLIKSGGFNAAVELGGDVQLLAAAAANNVNLPASVFLDKRTEVKGGKTFKFIVPVLDVGMNIQEIVAISSGAGGSLIAAVTAGGTPPLAISAGYDDHVIDAELIEIAAPAVQAHSDYQEANEYNSEDEVFDAIETGMSSEPAPEPTRRDVLVVGCRTHIYGNEAAGALLKQWWKAAGIPTGKTWRETIENCPENRIDDVLDAIELISNGERPEPPDGGGGEGRQAPANPEIVTGTSAATHTEPAVEGSESTAITSAPNTAPAPQVKGLPVSPAVLLHPELIGDPLRLVTEISRELGIDPPTRRRISETVFGHKKKLGALTNAELMTLADALALRAGTETEMDALDKLAEVFGDVKITEKV